MEYNIHNRSNNDELYHFRYLRKEKKDGKWRYYYERNNDGLHIGKTTKNKTTHDVFGKQVTTYTVTSPKTNYIPTPVTKETYDNTKKGSGLYIGKQRLSAVAKEQISMGTSFIKDLFGGNLYRTPKKK